MRAADSAELILTSDLIVFDHLFIKEIFFLGPLVC